VYQAAYSREARDQAGSLPPDARGALAGALEELRRDPWQGRPYVGHPREFRIWPFGTWGMVVYVILEQRLTVLLLEITWAG